MFKEFLVRLLQEYDEGKGLRRKMIGDDPWIIRLENFVTRDLGRMGNDEEILRPLLTGLYEIVTQRQPSLKEGDHYYEKIRLTNDIYFKIINQFAKDYYARKNILAMASLRRELEGESDNIIHGFSFFERMAYQSMIRARAPQHFRFLAWAREKYLNYFRNRPTFQRVLLLRQALQNATEVTFRREDLVRLEIDWQARLEQINLEEERCVISAFSYVDTMGILNRERLYSETLEDQDPQNLCLLSSGHLVHTADVIRASENGTGTLLNPESQSLAPIPLTDIQRLLVTRSRFFSAVAEMDQRARGEGEQQTLLISEKTLKKIENLANILRNDHGQSLNRSHIAVAQLSNYLVQLPEGSRNSIINFQVNGQAFGDFLQRVARGDICRHIVGMHLRNFVMAMQERLSRGGQTLLDRYNVRSDDLDQQTGLVYGNRKRK